MGEGAGSQSATHASIFYGNHVCMHGSVHLVLVVLIPCVETTEEINCSLYIALCNNYVFMIIYAIN